MWVRSQGKHALINADLFQVFDDKKTGTWAIKGMSGQYERVLGKYSTEVRALKVLDIIEKKIIENNTIVCNEKDWAKYVGTRNCVFQMPQDEEVNNDEKEN